MLSDPPIFLDKLKSTMRSTEFAVAGVSEQWAAPVAVIEAANGFGEEVWDLNQPDTLLAWRMAGSEVATEIPGFRHARTAQGDRKAALQIAGSSSRYTAAARVRFGHFYISEHLLTRVAEGLDLSIFTLASLRSDLIMFEDEGLWKQLNAYADRSADLSHLPSRIETEARALLIVEHLIGVYHLGRRKPALRGGLSPWQLKRSCEAMLARLDADIGLDELAGITGCSPTHFCRAFRQSIGMPPFQWRNERRIERAKELLADPMRSIAEIALEIGYGAQPQFTTAFGRATGRTPGQWRRERLT